MSFVQFMSQKRGVWAEDMQGTMTEIVQCYEKHLWHQIVRPMFVLLGHQKLPTNDVMDVIEKFVEQLSQRVKPLSYVRMVAAAVCRLEKAEERKAKLVALLEDAKKPWMKDAQSRIYAECAAARALLECGGGERARDLLDAAEKDMADVTVAPALEPCVVAAYHRARAAFHKGRGEGAEFFGEGLSVLSFGDNRERLEYFFDDDCGSCDSMALADWKGLVADLALAALVTPTVFRAGELLQHAVVERVEREDPALKLLVDMVRAFNCGGIDQFAYCLKAAESVPGFQPYTAALMPAIGTVHQKVSILAVMELALSMSAAESRHIPFDRIAETARIAPEDVELLLMRALCEGLVRGTIDQVDRTFFVSWVQPRALDKQQIGSLATKVDAWKGRMVAVLESVKM